jgi:hypothetical protein
VETVNQIIVTLKEADAFARSRNPHHHRLAIVLLDNIIELQLRRKSETAFAFDRTNWFSGVRKHGSKKRKNVSKYHAALLDLAVSESLITEAESRLLDFAHRIRNRAYHEGEPEDKVDLQLGITLLYRFIRRRFPEWKNGRFGMAETPRRPIPIQDAGTDESGWSPLLFGFEEDGRYNFLSDDHWSQVLDRCLIYDDSIDVRPLIKRRIDNLLDEVQGWLDQITEGDNMNFVPVLADRFSALSHVFCCCPKVSKSRIAEVGALNVYLAVLDHEERLLDVEDEAERDKEFRKLVREHDFQGDVISSLDIGKYRAIAEAVPAGTETEGIAQFLQIEKELLKIARAARECACDLDTYIEFLIDERRGK